jgi:hypothetical protein
MREALKDCCQVSLLTWVPRDRDRLAELRASLAARRDALSVATVVQHIRSIVDAF